MKRLAYLFVLLALLVAPASCTKPEEEPKTDPSEEPSVAPSAEPSADPSVEASEDPSEDPSEEASVEPSEDPSEEPSVPADYPVADLLDVIFEADGTAKNGAGSALTVTTVPGASLTTYYNEAYGRYVAHFNASLGSGTTSGYYKVDYSSQPAVRSAIKDGATMEALVRLDTPNPGSTEVKFFSSHQGGGIGFLIPTSGNGATWTFLPNVSPNGASNWVWTKSGVVPQVGRYVHLVGVWDRENNCSKIYVDGELKSTVATNGELNFPSANACWWFCIGGDPSGATSVETAWNGDVVLARIYGDPLGAEDVEKLWNAVDVPQSGDFVSLSNVRFMSPCSIRPGYKYYIYADGLQSGDQIVLRTAGGTEILPATTVDGDHATIVIGADIASGTYSLLCRRGTAVTPLGSVDLTVSADASLSIHTQTVAHRGVHTSASATENSIAALKGAQELGCYGSEFDVWMTTDGGLFINHDGVLNGVTIQNATTAQVAPLKLANGENISTLEQYLDQFKKEDKLRVVLEIKTHSSRARNDAVVDACIALVKEKGLVDRTDWIAFDLDNCKRIHAALPESMVEYLSGGRTPAQLYADGIMGLDYSSIQQSWVKEAHDLGMIVNVWTIDSTTEMLKYISWGVDYITTNKPAECEALCKTVWISE